LAEQVASLASEKKELELVALAVAEHDDAVIDGLRARMSTMEANHAHSLKQLRAQEEDADRCCVCLENKPDAIIVHNGTGHICCCFTCAQILVTNGASCPICRSPIEQIVKAFRG
jgi:hypothetical protein